MRFGWSVPLLIFLLLLLLLPGAASAQTGISGKVIDETGVAVAQALVELRLPGMDKPIATVSDASGNFTLELSPPAAGFSTVSIRSSRQGYFVYSGTLRLSPETENLTITLNHLQEFSESIDVTYSPPTIDLHEP